MNPADKLVALLARDTLRMDALRALHALSLPDGWIAAGFVRDAVWDHLHLRPAGLPHADVDVLWFDPACLDPARDHAIEQELARRDPRFDWSVKNQARMHRRNGDAPYASATDAMRFWCETATAVAVRLTSAGRLELSAPLGLDDLFALRLSPAGAFVDRKRAIFDARLAEKNWTARYPRLTVAPPG